MTWALLALLVLVFAVSRLARHRRDLVSVSRFDPIPTVRVGVSRNQSGKKRAALDAATAVLR